MCMGQCMQLERDADFQVELSQKNASMTEPFILGEDFNIIRFSWEKSSDNINETWVDAFNDSQGKIGSTGLVHGAGTNRYRWPSCRHGTGTARHDWTRHYQARWHSRVVPGSVAVPR
jgi:hypothetical protein